MGRATLVLVLALLFGAAGVGAAQAHDFLVSSNPANGSTLTHPISSVQLAFNDIVLTKPAAPDLVVTGPDGKHYETSCATSVDRDVSVPVALGPDGRYAATWRIVSADGHPVSASISFTFTAPSGFDRAPGSASAVCAAKSPASQASTTPQGGGSSAGWFVALAAAILMLMFAVVGVRIWSVRRSSGAEVDRQDGSAL